MADTTAFIIEAVIVLFLAILLLCLCVRQLYFDISEGEKLRPLIVCHYLTSVACVLQVIGNVDPQGGLEVYPEAFSVFVSQLRSMFLLSSSQSLAIGFVSSYKLMTQVTQGATPAGQSWAFLTTHAVYNTTALVLFLVQMFTRNIPIGIVSRCFMSLYSLIVSAHTIVSALQVRKILVAEHARTGKYAEGIYKLTRLVVLVSVLVVVGNATMMVTMKKVIDLLKTTHTYPDSPVTSFSGFNIFSDCAGLLALLALISGSWKVQSGVPKSGGSGRTTTRGSTTLSGRKSTPKLPSRYLPEPSSDSECGPPSPAVPSVESPLPASPEQKQELASHDVPAKIEARNVLAADAGLVAQSDQDNSNNRRRKLGLYQELGV